MVGRIRRAARTIKNYWFAVFITLMFIATLCILIVSRISELESVSNIAQLNPLISQSRGGLNAVDNQGRPVDAIKIDKSKNTDDTNSPSAKSKRLPAPSGGNSGSSSGSSSQPTSPRPKFDVTIEPIEYSTEIKCEQYTVDILGLSLVCIKYSYNYLASAVLTPHNPPGTITYQWKIASWGYDNFYEVDPLEYTVNSNQPIRVKQPFTSDSKNDESKVVLEVRSKSTGKLLASDWIHMVWKNPS